MNGIILIVEDDDNLIQILKETLEEKNYNVIEAKTISDAKKELTYNIFDCIILDLILPNGEGTDFLRYVKNKDLNLPIIILTAHPSLQSAIKGIKYDAFEYLEKPYVERKLIKTIKDAIRKKKLADEKELEFINLYKYKKKLEEDIKQKINELKEIESKYRELVENNYFSNLKEPEKSDVEPKFKLKDFIETFTEDKDLNPAKFAKIHLSCMMKIICLNYFCKNQKGITCQCRAPVLLLGCDFKYVCYNFYPKVKKEDLNLSDEEYIKYTRSKEFKTEQQWMDFLEKYEKSILTTRHDLFNCNGSAES